MSIFFMFVFFILGIIFGSFFNVVGLRLPQQQSFTKGRSHCPHCHTPLKSYELIPVISYLLQLGKCRHCRQPISIIYPITELLTGCLFALSYVLIGLNVELIVALLLMSMLMILFVSDLSYMIIPNKVLLFFLPLFIVLRFIEPLTPWVSSVTGAVVGFGLIAVIILISNGGMGAGDMKLFGVLGIVLGLKNVLLTFFLATIIGAVVSFSLLLFKKLERKQSIPFGPFIVIAAIVSYFFGHDMIAWYLNLLT